MPTVCDRLPRTGSYLRRQRFGLAGVLLLLSASAPAQADAPRRLHLVVQNGVEATAELGGIGGWGERVVFQVYFLSQDSDEFIDIDLPGDRSKRAEVALVHGVRLADIEVERCRIIDGIVQCRPLDKAPAIRIPQSQKLLEITLEPQKIEWSRTFFRLTVPAGALELSNGARGARRPAPEIRHRNLPLLKENEEDYLTSRPFLHVNFSPLARAENGDGGGFDDLVLDFDGGIYRSTRGGNLLWNVSWEGNVSNEKRIAFDRLAMDAGLSINLIPRDWLPLTLAVVGESDRDFHAVDVSGALELAYILPINVTLQSGDYRPALAPRLTVRAAAGSAVDRKLEAEEESFVRAGYEVLWRIPIEKSSHLAFHHAGTYNDPSGIDGDWFFLWDILLETKIGDVTYFIGYQEGQAAPLFQPTETTVIGLSITTSRPTLK